VPRPPATDRHLKRYLALLAPVSLALWGLARAGAYYDFLGI
jgi:hypothetical protein